MLSNKIALTKDVSAHLDFPAFYSYFAKKQNPSHFAENQLRAKQSRIYGKSTALSVSWRWSWHITGLARGTGLRRDPSVSYLKCWRPSVLLLKWSRKSRTACVQPLCNTPVGDQGLSRTPQFSHVISGVNRWPFLIPVVSEKLSSPFSSIRQKVDGEKEAWSGGIWRGPQLLATLVVAEPRQVALPSWSPSPGGDEG